MMPRPDVARLGVSYRRIPLLSVGRDVYLDTRLMLPKLESLFPAKPRLGATAPDQQALTQLLQSLMVDAGLFARGVQLLPPDLPLLRDPAYFRDRGDFVGAPLSRDAMARARPEAVAAMQRAFALFEHGFLADGRTWILGTPAPGLADIEGVWVFHWVTGLPGAVPRHVISEESFPRVFAWVARFQAAVSEAKKQMGSPTKLQGDDALALVAGAAWGEEMEGKVDGNDSVVKAQGLKVGDVVTVYPTDTGSSHRDVGKLVAMDATEVVIEVRAKDEAGTAIRLHAPRHGFRVKKGAVEKGDTKL
jgi:glutathione S-transferase